SLTRKLGTLAFFIMLNPHDLMNVLVSHFAGISKGEWRIMSSYQRACLVASHPTTASLAFHEQIQAFVDVILRYKHGHGLFGTCTAYYGMVEVQGRGTLHCHMLVWVEGNPNPNQLRWKMHKDSTFKTSVTSWLEDIIKCELPGMTNVEDMCPDLALVMDDDEVDP
ncbi:hypothetical protein M404DRAFT_162547, partial [Pisolithus tinctorius Marx 270]